MLALLTQTERSSHNKQDGELDNDEVVDRLRTALQLVRASPRGLSRTVDITRRNKRGDSLLTLALRLLGRPDDRSPERAEALMALLEALVVRGAADDDLVADVASEEQTGLGMLLQELLLVDNRSDDAGMPSPPSRSPEAVAQAAFVSECLLILLRGRQQALPAELIDRLISVGAVCPPASLLVPLVPVLFGGSSRLVVSAPERRSGVLRMLSRYASEGPVEALQAVLSCVPALNESASVSPASAVPESGMLVTDGDLASLMFESQRSGCTDSFLALFEALNFP